MKLVRWIQESWRRRRRQRPTHRLRFADQFAAALVIKPLENRLVLNGAPILQEVGVALTAEGSLLITGTSEADSVTVQSDVANSQYVISDSSHSLSITGIDGASLSSDGHTAFVPFTSVSGNQIVENLGGGDDVFNIDFTLGGFSKSIVIDGSEGNDGLAITGFGAIATYTPGDITGSGVIAVGGDQISFSGLEPIDYNVSGGTFVLDLAGSTNDNVTLSESTLLTDASLAAIDVAGAVDGVAFEDVRVRGSSIVINTHGGDDTVTLNATGNSHNDVDLTVNTGGDAADAINVNGTVAVSGTTTLNAKTINLNADISGSVTGSTATAVNVTEPGEVQDGLAVAASGGTVKLAAGNYDGAVSIVRAVSLTGSGDASTVILSGPISITASGTVVIDGLTVNNSITDPGADLTIQNSIITASGNAIDISGLNSALIQNNVISAGGDAVHGEGVTGNVTLQGNFITADRGVWLKDVDGQVEIGGLAPGEGNNILAFHEGIVLAGGIVGVVNIDGNLINAQGVGVDFEDGENDFTARGNDITVDAALADGAGILVHHSTSGNVTIGGTGVGEGNTITASGTAFGVWIDTVLSGDVSVLANAITATTTAVNVKALSGGFTISGNSNVSSDTAEDVLVRDVAGNVTIQGNSFGGFGTFGLDLQNVGTDSASSVLIGGSGLGEGNTLFGPQTGFSLVNARNLTVENNSLVQTTLGIYISLTPGLTAATLSGNTINTASTGEGIVLDGRTGTTRVNFGSGNTITGGTDGLLIEGAGMLIPSLTLNDLVLDSQTGNCITLSDGALVGQEINGTGVTYGSLIGSTVTVAQGYQIADRVVDAIDDGSLGFVRVRSGQVYVTENSFNAPNTTVANIQRAVDAAVSGDTIHIHAGNYTGDIDTTAPGKSVTLSPGDRPGQVVNSGNLTLDAGDTLAIQVDTTVAATGYDNFVIVGGGTVTLNNATLMLSGSITAAPTDVVLIDNDGVEAVVGIFNGLPEQTLVNINGVNFRLTYHGGADGNDVVLRSGANADTFVTLVSDGMGGFNLLIYDFNAPSDDRLTIESDVANSRYIISDPNLIITTDIPSAGGDISHTVFVPFAVVTGGSINVNTREGNDNLTIDYFRGNFSKAVNFDAGDGINDSLTLVNTNAVVTTYAAVQHTFTTTSSGSIAITSNGLVTYSNLEPIFDNLIAASREFTFTGSNNDHIVLADAGTTTDSLESISSEFSDLVTFRDPTTSLTINAGDGDDVIRINQLDTNYQAAISVLGQAGVDEIQQFADLTLATTQASGDLFYQAEKITLSGDLHTPGTATYDTGFTAASVGVTESTGATIAADKLRFLGKGTFAIEQANDVATLAANVDGTLAYTDVNALTVGIVATTSGITTIGSDVKLTTGGNLSLEAAIALGAGDLTLNTTGNVSQLAAGTITASGLQILGSGTVRLDTAANNVTTLAAEHTGTISYTDADSLTIASVTDTAAAVSVSTTGITTTGSDVKLTTGSDLSLEAAIALGAGDLTLNTTGNVSQLAAGAITASGLQILGSGTVRLDAAANNVTTLAANHTGTISYTDTDGLTIGTVTDTSAAVSVSTSGITTTGSDVRLTTGGDLSLEAAIALGAGDLTLNTTGNVSQLAAGAITANGLQILGTGTVRLDTATNNVTTLVASHTGTISYTDTDSLTIGTVTDTAAAINVSTNGITTTGSDVKLTTGGDLALEAAIALSAGDLTLNATGNVSQLNGGAITARGLQILGSGTVRLDAAANNITTLAANHTGTISYNDTNSLTVGTVTDTAAAVSFSTTGITTSGSDVKLNTGGDLALEAAITLGAGDLTLNTTGSVSQLAAGAITANGLQIRGTGTVRLDTAANNVTTLAANHTGTISYTDTNGLTVGTVTDTAAAVSVSTSGITTIGSDVKLTTGGDLAVEAAVALGASDLTLNTSGNVSQLAAGTITANGLQILGSGTVRLDTAANNITTLAANHTGTISYNDTNSLTVGTVTDTAAAVSVSTTGITTSGADVKLNTGGDLALEAAITLGAGDLTLNTTGSVSQLAAGAITANGLQILGTGTVRLDTAANNVTTLAANHTGTISYTDTNGLTVGTVTDTAAAVSVSTSGITTTGSDVKLTTGGDLAVEAAVALGAGDLTLNTSGNVSQLAAGTITANGLQILGSGTVRLDTAANNITTLAANHTGTISYNDTNSLTVGTVTDTAAAVSVSTSGVTTNGSDVKLTTGGELSFEAAIGLGAGDLTLNTTGNVSQLVVGFITANGLQILGTGTVRLDTAANNVTTLAANHTGTISYTDTNGLTVGTVADTAAAVSVSTTGITTTGSDVKLTTGGDFSLEAAVALRAGDLTLNITGNVSQLAAGAITASGLQILGSGTVRLDAAANNVVTLAANHTGTISYTDANGLTIGTVTDTAAAVSVSTTGITTTGTDVKLTTLGDLALEAAISVGAGDLTLNTTGDVSQLAPGSITANGLQVFGSGTVRLDTAANNVAILAANHTGTISYTDTNGITIGTVTDTAAAVSVATTGITTTGSDVMLTTGGDLALEAAISLGAGDLTLNTTGNVSQLAAGAITANGVQVLGSGTVRLDTAANNVAILAANHTGTISYTDTNSLTIGTITDTAAAGGVATTGITTTGSDVKLTTGGDLSLEAAITLGAGDLTLNTTGNVSQLAAGAITASGLQILGTGTVRLDTAANNVTTLAANHPGTISYTDTNSLTVGTVTDTAAAVSVSTSGIAAPGSDVKLTTGGDLSLEAAIALDAGDLTLNTTGNVSQLGVGSITAGGLQILGNGTVRLDTAANNVATLAANYAGTISYTDTNSLTSGTVTDTAAAVGVSTSGITTTGSDVKLTTGGDLSLEAAIALGAGDLTLNTAGNITQLATGAITATGLQILGSGTVRLDTAANNVNTLAANHFGTISYTDNNSLTVGSVIDMAAAISVSTSGISSSGFDVMLTAGGDLLLESAVVLGAGNLTINATGTVSQAAAGGVTANGLQILGTGTINLALTFNDIDTLAANYTGSINYTDTNSLTIGTVADTAASVNVSTSGIKTSSGDIAINSGGLLTVNQTIDTNPGTGGLITVANAILNAALIAGSGNITLNGGGSDLIINFDQASSTTLTYSADRDIIIRATVAANGVATNLVLRADADNDGVGGFWLDEGPLGTDAKLIAGQDISIQGSDLSITPAADSILIDSDAAAVQILAGRDISLTGNVISGPGTTPTTNADIFINGLQTATAGSIFIDAADVISLSADQNAGTDITLKDATQLNSSVNLIAGRDMTFAGRIDDDGNVATSSSLTITAARDVAFFGNVGESQALSSLTITGAAGVIFGDADNSAPNAAAINTIRTTGDINIGSLAPIGNRGIIFDGGTTANSLVTMTTIGGGTVRLNGAVRLDSDLRINTAGTSDGTILFTNDSPIDSQIGEFNDLSLNAGTGSVVFNEDLGAAQRLGALTVETASQVTFGEADVETPAAGTTGPVNAVNTNGAVNIGSQSVISGGIVFNGGSTLLTVTTNNANVRLNGAATLNSNLKIDTGAGVGDITFTAASTGSGRIDSQTGEHNDLTLNAGTGSIFFNGNIGANQSLGSLIVDTAAGGVTFGGSDIAVTGGSGPLTTIRTEGIIDIGSGTNAADVIGGTGIIFNGGNSQLAVTTNNANVRLNGAVTLHSSLKISTGSGTGDVVFTNDTPIDSQAGEFNALTIDAGTGVARFNEDLGKIQRLGALTVERASQVIFGEADSEVGSGSTGPVNEINTNGQIDIGSVSVITGGILFNGGASNLLTITTLGDSVRLNGTATLATNLRIDTDSTSSGTEGGDISFTAASPIDSISGETNDLTLDAGTGNITFAATVGRITPLSTLTIEQAQDVTFQSTLQTAGSLIQASGTGTTTFHGVSGGGIGGQLDVTTVNVVLATADIITVGPAKIVAAQSLSFGDLAGLNAGSSAITLGAGSGGLTQASTAIIQTANNTENALQIAVGNGGNARISDLRVGTIGGTIHLTAGGAIVDNSLNEGANLTANVAILEAGTGIGASGAADIDTEVSILSAKTAQNDIFIQERDAVQLGRAANENLNAADGSIVIDAGGSITIVQAAVAGSANNQGPTARAASITLQTGGFIQIDSAVTANHGSITINATTTNGNVLINGEMKTFGGSISVDSGGVVQINEEATATNGSIAVKTENSNGNILINGNLKAPQGTITVTAGGLIQIHDGVFLQSAASDYVKQSPGEIVTGGPSAVGQVSNAPPRLQITQIDPNDVILPADRTQEVRGAIGVGGNLEQGANLTLTVTWADGKTTVLTGLQAGDSVTWQIDENGNTTGATIQHGSNTGQITIDRIERTYSLTFLAGLTDNKVTADFQLSNDRFIQLVDASSRDLNRSDVTAITTTVANKDVGRPPLVLLEQPRVVVAEVRAAVHTEVVQNLIVVINRYQDLNLSRAEGQTEGPVLFLVSVGPDGEEGARVLLPVTELKNLSGLLERLKKAQIPSAMYRLYYQEPGLPPQQVLEFRKTGNTIGDPVREPGRGTNPVGDQPAAQQPAAPARDPNQLMQQRSQPGEPAIASIETAIAQATDQSFTRAARLLRGRPR